MAGRTGMGVGLGVTVTLLGVACLALFVLTIVFLSEMQAAQRQAQLANDDLRDFVRQDERGQDQVRVLVDQARKQNKSVVAYLSGSLQDTMRTVTGTPRDTYEGLRSKLSGVRGADSAPLLQVVANRDREIADLTRQLGDAQAARDAAVADQTNERERVRLLEAAQQATVDDLNAKVNAYRDEIDQYRRGVEELRAQMEARVDAVQQEALDRQARLSDQVASLQEENLLLQNQISLLRAQKGGEVLRPKDEFALVDGRVVGINPAERQVYIGLGRKQKVVLGMTFSVYADAAAIRPDPNTGEYPRGKASLEVINIGEDTSTCLIVEETRGNPVVKGDVIANALYDPGKTYTFVVYGNFDANADGKATPGETEDIKTVILNWQGRVSDELQGDVDFLVLGQRPVLPPAPPPGAPIEVVQEYIRIQRTVDRYDALFKQAQSTSVPILNENRLYTLTGKLSELVR